MIKLAVRLMPFVGLLALPAFADYTGCAVDSQNNCVTVFSQGINVYFGTAQLFVPGNVLLSTTSAMTLDLAPGPDLASQIASDPTAPAYVAANIGGFADNTDLAALIGDYLSTNTNGLGPLLTSLGLTVNPVTFANPDQALFAALTNQSVPFAIASDTGFSLFGGGPLVFQYFTGPLGPYSLNSVNYSFEGVTNVNFWERDLQLVETPEPGYGWLLILGCLGAGVFARKNRSRA